MTHVIRRFLKDDSRTGVGDGNFLEYHLCKGCTQAIEIVIREQASHADVLSQSFVPHPRSPQMPEISVKKMSFLRCSNLRMLSEKHLKPARTAPWRTDNENVFARNHPLRL